MDGWSWSLKTHHSIFKMVVELTDAVSEKDDSPINGPLKALLASADVAIKSTIQIRKSAVSCLSSFTYSIGLTYLPDL